MGMAASQARLLTLTSRLHDVEYKAQNIESQKIALATQKDELYQNYCDALDAKKFRLHLIMGTEAVTLLMQLLQRCVLIMKIGLSSIH